MLLILLLLTFLVAPHESYSVDNQLSSRELPLTEGIHEACNDTWFIPSGPNGSCECGHSFSGMVSCDQVTKEVGVLDCYCMTYDSVFNRTVFGQCLYNCINVTKSYHDFMYHRIPRNLVSHDDNNSVCGYLNRTGRLCGQCIKDHYKAAYSYVFTCTYCESSQWWQYILVAYGPLTIFIIFILVFRVSVVSPQLYGVISMFQTLASPLNIRVIQQAASHDTVKIMVQVFLLLLSIWNLDFFRNVMPTRLCLRLSSLSILALDYFIAVYPMIVTVIAFLVLKLHDRGFRPIFYLCRPFHRIFANFRQGWNLRTSLIDAFVTFFILSTTKLLHVSVSVLLNVQVFDAQGKSHGYFWLEEPSIAYFGPEHRKYGILAIFVIFFLIFLPVCLLVGYQFAFIRAILTKTRIMGPVLEEFMHSFNQYYKDGSDGTRDCRWFAAFYIMNRLGVYMLLFFTLTATAYNYILMYVLVCTVVVIMVEPYKKEYQVHNSIEPCLILTLALIQTGITGVNMSNVASRQFVKSLFMYTSLVAMIPMAYLAVVTIWWLIKRSPCRWRLGRQTHEPDLPDRLLNSGDYHNSFESSSMSTNYDSNSLETV